jgi:hypothetical protein
MKECDAPESNNTLAVTELIRNVPRMTSGASSASSALTYIVQATFGSIGLVLLISSWGSMALALGGLRHVEARCCWLLERALLREVSWLSTCITVTSLATVIGVSIVAVATRVASASSVVAAGLMIGVVGFRGLRCKSGWWGRRPGWGQTAGSLAARSTLHHHPPLAALKGCLMFVFYHDGGIHHGFEIKIWHSHKISL